MKEVLAVFGIGIFGVALLTGLSFYGNFIGLSIKKMFGPANVAVDRQIFEESQSYNEGMRRDLENLRMQYLGASEDQRLALKATMLHRFAAYPQEKLSPELRSFYVQLRGY